VILLNFTRRFICLLCLGFLILIFGIIVNNYFSLFIIYNLICAALLITDYFISVNEQDFIVERCGDENLSIYEKESIGFKVYNKGDYKLYVKLKDEIPDFHFKAENKIMEDYILPKEKKFLQYFVVPTKRGAFTFNNVYVKCRGKLGLCEKIFKINISKEYKVYPNLKNLRKYRISICNNRMFKQGQRNLRILGKGTSFESLREYVSGDEYRKINWKVTARANKPIINQYEPEKNQHVYIFIDAGRPMSYSIKGYRKLDMAVNTALVLSDVVNRTGDQSALILFSTEVKNMLLPGKGNEHRAKMLEMLYHVQPNNETSNYDEAFYYFKKKERHNSIIFLFTDFDTLEEAENMIKVLPIISRNNRVVIILMKNEELNKISTMEIKNEKDIFNKGVALELLEDRRKIISLLNRRGVLCLECAAEEIEYAAVNKYIQVKNKSYL